MRKKLLLGAIMAWMSFSSSLADGLELDSKFEVIHEVSVANEKLNKVFKGLGMPKTAFRDHIYAANDVLVEIRSLLLGAGHIDKEKIERLEAEVQALHDAVAEIDENASEQELTADVDAVKQKAVTLRDAVKKMN